jgi:hypothetical protein
MDSIDVKAKLSTIAHAPVGRSILYSSSMPYDKVTNRKAEKATAWPSRTNATFDLLGQFLRHQGLG